MYHPKQKFSALLSTRLWFHLLFCLCTLTFGALAGEVWLHEWIRWDAPIALALHHFARPWLDYVMQAITETAGSGALFLVAGISGWGWFKAQRTRAFTIMVILSSALLLNMLLKLFFARPRPLFFPPLVVETDYSFPSGHTVAGVILYGGLALLLWQQRHYLWATLAASWIGIVGLSRVYLGVHYPSDVLAAFCIGIVWLFAAFALYNTLNTSGKLDDLHRFLQRRIPIYHWLSRLDA